MYGDVIDHSEWDEGTIQKRSVMLFDIARKVWP